MKVRLITIGKLKSAHLQALVSEYVSRIGHYLPFELLPVKKEEDILKKISRDDFLVALDERGSEMSSKELADFLEVRQIRSTRALTFVIGPAEGFSKNIKAKAQIVLALSKFTLQHDLALLILLEQLYRACTIIRGEPYHK